MTKIVICPSVQHTGHNFMVRRIFEPYYIPHPPNRPLPDDDRNYMLTGHFNDNHNFDWNGLSQKFPVYMPLRHPARVLESFMRRNTVASSEAAFRSHWRAMMAFVKQCPTKIYYLHLDSALRCHQAGSILKSLDINDKTVDWSVTEETGSKQGTHDLELTGELIKRVPKFFIDFYEETKHG